MITKEIIWTAVKEPLRLLVLAVIPLLLVYFEQLPVEWAGIMIVLLRLIDSVLHQVGKAQEAEGTKAKPIELPLTTGLTRF